jgi:hypothetical protein
LLLFRHAVEQNLVGSRDPYLMGVNSRLHVSKITTIALANKIARIAGAMIG